MKKSIFILFSLLWSFALQAGISNGKSTASQIIENTPTEKDHKAPRSKFSSWLVRQLQRKIAAKQQRLEKKKQDLKEKGKLKRVAKIQKTQDGLATLGIILMISGLFSIIVGLVLLLLSFNTGVYSFFISLGGLGLVVGFVLLLIGLVQ